MGYFSKSFKDPGFWFRTVFLPALGALNLADILSAVLASPGFFRLWVVRITVMAGLAVAIAVASRNSAKQRKKQRDSLDQRNFEIQRMEALRRRVSEDPEFQTFCFRCRYYDAATLGCTREIINLSARRVRLDSRFQYCLYWEPIEDQ